MHTALAICSSCILLTREPKSTMTPSVPSRAARSSWRWTFLRMRTRTLASKPAVESRSRLTY